MRELMRKYRDLPMDLADATLVRAAEREKISRVFTIDRRDFEVNALEGSAGSRSCPEARIRFTSPLRGAATEALAPPAAFIARRGTSHTSSPAMI
jgi:hypothetical protein